MGLDIAELALEIEERYAVELDGDDWANVCSFGDVIDTVKRKIERPLDPAIEKSGNEIILQALLAESRLHLPRNVEINEETQLRKLRRYTKTHMIWSIIQQRFPEVPSALNNRQPSCVGCLNVVIVVCLIISGIIFDWFGKNLWTILVIASAWLGMTFVYPGWRIDHLSHQTVGSVAHSIAEKRQKLLKSREYSSDDIENELRDYMSKAFALKPEKIRRESDLVKDLGLG